MAVESKPLFHPEVIRQQVRSFILPDSVENWQPKLQHWSGLIASGRADDFNETALLPDFLTDIFCGLLGYSGPAGPADPGASTANCSFVPIRAASHPRIPEPDAFAFSI